MMNQNACGKVGRVVCVLPANHEGDHKCAEELTPALDSARAEGEPPQDGEPSTLEEYRAGYARLAARVISLEADKYAGEQAAPGLRALIPAEVWKRYDEAAEKASSVGALKQLKNAEAEIGRLFVRAALTAPVPREPQHERWCAKYPRRMDTFRTQEEIDAISKLKCDCGAAPVKDARPYEGEKFTGNQSSPIPVNPEIQVRQDAPTPRCPTCDNNSRCGDKWHDEDAPTLREPAEIAAFAIEDVDRVTWTKAMPIDDAIDLMRAALTAPVPPREDGK